MAKHNYSTAELVGRWEDRRDIKNQLGRLLNAIQLNRDLAAFETYWSKEREDISLGFNGGFYRGRDAVSGYYRHCFERNRLIACLMQKQLPDELAGRTEEGLYGIGEMRFLPSSSAVIEIAGDGETAKGIWTLLGNTCAVTETGPASYWTWGYFCADFVREGIEWRIWHLMVLTDIHHLCGQSWAAPERPLPPLKGFEALAECQRPPFTEAVTLRTPYSAERKRARTPRLPEPYYTFGETFSYGEKEGACHDL